MYSKRLSPKTLQFNTHNSRHGWVCRQFPGKYQTPTLESYVYLYMLDKHNYKVREIYNWASIMLKFKTYFNKDIKQLGESKDQYVDRQLDTSFIVIDGCTSADYPEYPPPKGCNKTT